MAEPAPQPPAEREFGARRWLFGPGVLDERTLELLVNGAPVEIERKPLQVLLHLLAHAGEVVTKDELIEAVWPGRVISDAALTKCMAKLRDALHDDAQSVIRTQHGFGYRLVAPVRIEASVAPPPPRFAFETGDPVPGRPQWGLRERLGTGGHGEAWLAVHEKTREARVFKFALDGPPRIKLSDFGSGGVLDASRLQQMGITQLGFTRVAGAAQGTSGTPLYVAPEVVAGQPFTLRADIYSIGVMLYQLAVGDFGRALAPGWERDVPDELLREDIAAAAEGHVERRLADAALLARRLRTLEARRAERAAQRTALERAARTERMRREVRRWRGVAAVMGAMVVATTTAGALAIQKRNEAISAGDEARAVSDFLTKDLFESIDSSKRATGKLSARDLVDEAASVADARFADQPRAAARLHYSLGNAYASLSAFDQAREQLGKAAVLFEALDGRDAEPTLDALFWEGVSMKWQGHVEQARQRQTEVVVRLERLLGKDHPKLWMSRAELAAVEFELGDWQAAAGKFREVIASQERAQAPLDDIRLVRTNLATMLWYMADYAGAEAMYRELFASYEVTPPKNKNLEPQTLSYFAELLLNTGRHAESEKVLARLESFRDQYPDTEQYLRLSSIRGCLLVEQGYLDEGIGVLENRLAQAGNKYTVDSYLLAGVYNRAGRYQDAVPIWRFFVSPPEPMGHSGPDHPEMIFYRAGLAEALRGTGDRAGAWAALKAITPGMHAKLPQRHPHLADLRRVEGLLWLDEKQYDKARAALQEALDIQHFRRGADHWRTRRVREELARVPVSRSARR